MEMKLIKYRIAMQNGSGKWKTKKVSGFAVKSDLPIQFCVREYVYQWTADEYTTGFSLSAYGASAETCAINAERTISKSMAAGNLEPSMEKARKIIRENML